MEVLEQSSTRLIIVHRNSKGGRLLSLAGALFCLAVCGLFLGGMFEEGISDISISLVILSVMFLGMMFLAYVCLVGFWGRETYEFDKEADTFVIIQRTLRGQKRTSGALSGILITRVDVDYSSVDAETGASSEIIIRYRDGASTKTITCGSGIAEDDQQLHRTLRKFLNS